MCKFFPKLDAILNLKILHAMIPVYKHNSHNFFSTRACERSGKRSEAGRNWLSGNGAVSGGQRKRWSVSGARGGEFRSGNRVENGMN